MSKPPTYTDLDRLPQIDHVLSKQKEQYEDCTPCRLMGSAAFTGLGIYTYASGRKQLIEREKEILRSGTRFGIAIRRLGLVGLSAALVGAGAWRLIN